jgi:CheY-like chemotaxis protein
MSASACPPGGEPPAMNTGARSKRVLVVDDAAFDRELVARLLGSMGDVETLFAHNGKDGLALIEHESPAIVLTDLVMPDVDGLELVHQIRALHPQIPVVLMTAYGSEDVAMRALRAGAANYIPKRDLVRDLAQTLRKLFEIASARGGRGRILRCLVERESTLSLANEPDLLIALIALVDEELEGMGSWDAAGRLQVCIALQEALTNALFHGNLEVSSTLREDDEAIYYAEANRRRHQEPYRSRRLCVQIKIDREGARFVIADEGPGFDTTVLDRPVEPDDLNRIGGRGLLLIRTFMDRVSFDKSGSEITLVKRRSAS